VQVAATLREPSPQDRYWTKTWTGAPMASLTEPARSGAGKTRSAWASLRTAGRKWPETSPLRRVSTMLHPPAPPRRTMGLLGRAMPTRTNPSPASDEQVRALLERYKCPVPFHEVRARFLGNIASPVMSASPLRVVEDLWGGELPPFDTIDDANELIGALVMGLWNRLTRHQDRNSPFRLLRTETAPTREGLAALALMRRQELDGFVAGLFGRSDVIDLPERARRSLNELAEMRAAFGAVFEVVSDEAKSATERDMETTLRHMREMTKSAEHEVHTIVMACTRARKQMLARMPTKRPTVH
jgi:hypothetical protein